MEKADQILVFSLGGHRFALTLLAVDRVVRVVAITPLPELPDFVLGVINVQGEVIPVIDVHRRFGLPQRDIALTDQLVIARTARRAMALRVDTVTEVIECPDHDRVAAERILPELEHVKGVVKLEDGLVLIFDLERFLSLEADDALNRAIASI